MMTIKLYDTDSHIQQFNALVTSCEEREDRRSGQIFFIVELDQTAFFAEGGGQAADRGTITDEKGIVHPVLDVQEIKEHIYHKLDAPLSVGEKVTGQIDWKFRFDNMQQHSGEHILSGLCYAWKGYHNVGFHLGEEFTTIDFDGPLSAEEIKKLEYQANQIVYRNIPITVSYPSVEELARMDYRSKKELTGRVRIVKVGNYDLCACCAPHVMLTGEIGLIKVIRFENYKGGVRLTILCGGRAVRDYQKKNDLVHQVAAGFSTKPEMIGNALQKQAKELEEMKAHTLDLNQTLIRLKAEKLIQEAQEGNGSIRFVEDLLDPVALRSLVNQLTEQIPGHVICLIPKKEPGEYGYIAASASEDVRTIAALLKDHFGARGGGSAQMVQGSVKGTEKEIMETIG